MDGSQSDVIASDARIHTLTSLSEIPHTHTHALFHTQKNRHMLIQQASSLTHTHTHTVGFIQTGSNSAPVPRVYESTLSQCVHTNSRGHTHAHTHITDGYIHILPSLSLSLSVPSLSLSFSLCLYFSFYFLFPSCFLSYRNKRRMTAQR